MRVGAILLVPALLLATSTASADSEGRAAERQRIVDRELAGKTAGEPEDCISARSYRRLIVASDSTLLFRVSSTLVYRNDLQQSCPGMADSPFEPAIDSRGSRVCRGDIATVERGPQSSCALGVFVPYRSQ